tara:strand:- start:16163 stop:16444 length:282 start_codon:yes stop_codon:yes gene_type:complete
MARQIKITKYKDNTHYSVYVIDSYGTEHHIGYEQEMHNKVLAKIEQKACDIWANEVEPKIDPMQEAIASMIEHERKNGIRYTDNMGNHRDGLD